MDIRERVIVALDLEDADEAVVLAGGLRDHARRVKVGLTLYLSAGVPVVERLRALGFEVFLDLKLHDIPHQVEGACRAVVGTGAEMLTVHASGGRDMLRAAVRGAASEAAEREVRRPAVLAVTVLTSLDRPALQEVGVERGVDRQVAALAEMAREEGVDGVVCSPREAAAMRALLGPEALVVTPGVRPHWAQTDDQARTATPAEALAEGASHLVIGRPVTAAADPARAFERLFTEGL